MMKLVVLNKNAFLLRNSFIWHFKPDMIIITKKKVDGLIQLLINKNYEIYKESIK
jgi:hypothetical protein